MWSSGRGNAPAAAGRGTWLFGALVAAVLYLTFLIVSSEWQDLRRDRRMGEIRDQNESLSRDILALRRRLALLQTPAYRDRFNKQTQNRKNPSEEVTVVVDEKLVSAYPGIDAEKVSYGSGRAVAAKASATVGMGNLGKWAYHLSRGSVR